jgi:hypothetical protein
MFHVKQCKFNSNFETGMFHVKHLFSDAKLAENLIQNIDLDIGS